jgi:hypothetical protein
MFAGNRTFARQNARAVRVKPRVKFESARVSFRNGECKRVVKRLRSFAELACEIIRPRFEIGFVKCVASGADLENDGVEFEVKRVVEDG